MFYPIPDYEGFYEIDEFGTIRSVERRVPSGRGLTRLVPQKTLSPPLVRGYKRAGLCTYGKHKLIFVHILVARTFIGRRPEGYQVCHIDGNPLNNHYSNLRYGTPKENQKDRLRHGTDSRGSKCKTSKLTESQVIEMREMFKNGFSQSEIARLFNVTYSCSHLAIRRKSWAWLP